MQILNDVEISWQVHYSQNKEKIMTLTKLITGAALIAAFTSSAFADGHTIRMGTEGAYPPYNFVNDSGEVDGFEREVGDELCKRANLNCTWVINDWDSIIPN